MGGTDLTRDTESDGTLMRLFLAWNRVWDQLVIIVNGTSYAQFWTLGVLSWLNVHQVGQGKGAEWSVWDTSVKPQLTWTTLP